MGSPMLRRIHAFSILSTALLMLAFSGVTHGIALAQTSGTETTQPPQTNSQSSTAISTEEKNKYSQEPFVIEHFITRAAFQNDGTGRTDLELTVHVLNETGVQQFAQLVFGYNSDNQKIEIIFIYGAP